jgi:anti-sigma regulatory factor (Ser/Thr protein kinase)
MAAECPAPGSMQMQVAPERAALETTRQAVLRFLEPCALSARAIYAVELVLEEVLSNVIAYAFPPGRAGSVGLGVTILADAVELRVDDDGVEFDPLGAPTAPTPASIDEATPGGLGLLLVRRFARAVDYRRTDGRNVLTVTVATSP